MSTRPKITARLRQLVPLIGTALLLGWFLWSTDLARVGDALRMANLGAFIAVVFSTTLVVWLYDSYCITWLIRTTLAGRGRPDGAGMRDVMPLKAASYVLNIVNYHAATFAMAWLIGRRKGVSFLEAAGALAAMSWIDLVAVTGMAVTGLWLAPEVLGAHAELQTWLQAVGIAVFSVALAVLLVLQSGWKLPILVRLRQFAPLRPLAALGPLQMLQGIAMRAVLVLTYTVAAVLIMRAFGMHPVWGRMLVAIPILTVVGTIPISVSGLGTTQVLMRSLYAPFVTDREPGPVIDAYSTAMIVAYILVRLLVAAPFLRAVARELREKPPSSAE